MPRCTSCGMLTCIAILPLASQNVH
jgi:hypothetical protein